MSSVSLQVWTKPWVLSAARSWKGDVLVRIFLPEMTAASALPVSRIALNLVTTCWAVSAWLHKNLF